MNFSNFFIILLVLQLTACANFFSSDRDVEPGFRQKMVPAEKSLPLPVEIAQEIAEISENGTVYLTSNKNEEDKKQVSVNKLDNTQVVLSKDPRDINPETIENKIDSQGPLMQKLKSKELKGPLKFAKIVKRLPQSDSGKTISYIVKLGDTLMKIAFEKYGNYLRWKELYKVNRKKMSHYTKMKIGTELTIHNVKYIYLKKEGVPYLIKKGDTLKTIAGKVYGTSEKWRDIWKNNPQLILNPKRIYAGFTLYYQENLSREPSKTK